MYDIATNILSAFPLLLKGIVLIYIVSRRPSVRASTAIGAREGDLEILEYWDVDCKLSGVLDVKHGVVFIVIALWFMMTASYTEFFMLEKGSVPKKTERVFSKWEKSCP